MKKENGIATLSIVSGIVAIGALFSFSVMKLGINETKKTQNLMVKANEKAHVRAAIDCAVAVFDIHNLDPRTLAISEFDDCKVSEKTAFTLNPFIKEEKITHWTLIASHGFASAGIVIATGGSSFSAFKTSGSLEIIGGNDWESATGNNITIDGADYVECTAIIAGGSVTIDVQQSNADFRTRAPIGSLSCAPTHSTVIPKGSGAVSEGFELDILSNQRNIDVFKDLFGVTKEKWSTIRSQFDTVIRTGSAIFDSLAVSQCGLKIKEAITAGDELIWVDGDCLLNDLSNTGTPNQSPLIVIKNGIVGLEGTLANFKGTIFQFTFDYPNKDLAKSWGPQAAGICEEGAMKNLCLQLINVWGHDLEKWSALPFYIYGSFSSDGGYLIDIPNTTALIEGGFQMSYDDGLEENAIVNPPPKVLKGSYHDF